MKPEYEPKNVDQVLGYLVEECGEVLQAVGKATRWGLLSRNPESDRSCAICEDGPRDHDRVTDHAYKDPRETNREWILRELDDLEGAIKWTRDVLR